MNDILFHRPLSDPFFLFFFYALLLMSEYVHFVFALGQLRASSFHELTVLQPRRIPSVGALFESRAK